MPVLDWTYGYDEAGNVTSMADVTPGAVWRQCFGYDHHRRLTDAWTQSAAACAKPSGASPDLGSTAPYWDTFSYDASGNRTQRVQRTGSGAGMASTTLTSTYPNPTSTHPHQPNTVARVGASSGSESLTVDDLGQLKSRSGGTGGAKSQTLIAAISTHGASTGYSSGRASSRSTSSGYAAGGGGSSYSNNVAKQGVIDRQSQPGPWGEAYGWLSDTSAAVAGFVWRAGRHSSKQAKATIAWAANSARNSRAGAAFAEFAESSTGKKVFRGAAVLAVGLTYAGHRGEGDGRPEAAIKSIAETTITGTAAWFGAAAGGGAAILKDPVGALTGVNGDRVLLAAVAGGGAGAFIGEWFGEHAVSPGIDWVWDLP